MTLSFFCALLGFLVGIIPLYTQLCVVELPNYLPLNYIRMYLLFHGIDLYSTLSLHVPFCICDASNLLPNVFNTIPSTTMITEVRFRTTNEYATSLIFFAMQERIFAPIGETSLVFFRIENTTFEAMTVYILYYVYPEDVRLFLYKVQCFCFSEIFVDQQMLLDLPVLFYISTNINKAICYLCYNLV